MLLKAEIQLESTSFMKTEDPTPKAPPDPGTRLAIVLFSWGFAGFSVLTSVALVGAGFGEDEISLGSFLSLVPLVAWIALAVMSVRWVQGRQCHWAWPIVGTLCGLLSAITFMGAFITFVAAVPLAIHLTFWHLKRRND